MPNATKNSRRGADLQTILGEPLVQTDLPLRLQPVDSAVEGEDVELAGSILAEGGDVQGGGRGR